MQAAACHACLSARFQLCELRAPDCCGRTTFRTPCASRAPSQRATGPPPWQRSAGRAWPCRMRARFRSAPLHDAPCCPTMPYRQDASITLLMPPIIQFSQRRAPSSCCCNMRACGHHSLVCFSTMTSMAPVRAGVPVKQPAAGMAMGLVPVATGRSLLSVS